MEISTRELAHGTERVTSDRVLTRAEAAARVGLSLATIGKWVRSGYFEADEITEDRLLEVAQLMASRYRGVRRISPRRAPARRTQAPPREDRELTVADAAERMDRSESTIRQWVRRGYLQLTDRGLSETQLLEVDRRMRYRVGGRPRKDRSE